MSQKERREFLKLLTGGVVVAGSGALVGCEDITAPDSSSSSSSGSGSSSSSSSSSSAGANLR